MNRINAVSFAKLLKEIAKAEYTIKELAEETGLHYLTVCNYTRALHNEGVIHVARWDVDVRGRMTAKVFGLGTSKDSKRHKALTHAERSARYRAAQKNKAASVFHLSSK